MKFWDRPTGLTVLLCFLVATHALVCIRWPKLGLWHALGGAADLSEVPVYLGLSGTAAFVGGFAGVVIVFALSSSSDKFIKFRRRARRSLRANSISIISSSLTAAAIAVGAAIVATAGKREFATWMFELSAVILIHGSVRMVWFLRVLIGVVETDDERRETERRQEELRRDLFPATAQVRPNEPAG